MLHAERAQHEPPRHTPTRSPAALATLAAVYAEVAQHSSYSGDSSSCAPLLPRGLRRAATLHSTMTDVTSAPDALAATSAEAVAAPAGPVPRPDRAAYEKQLAELNAELEILEEKRNKLQSRIAGSRKHNDELTVRAGGGGSGCDGRVCASRGHCHGVHYNCA
jgi:hypothetical protein